MKKQTPFLSFFWSLATMIIVITSFFIGAVADRLFVVKPIDYLLKQKGISQLISQFESSESAQLRQDSDSDCISSNEETIINSSEKASQSVVTVAIKTEQKTLSITNLFDFDLFNFLPQNPQNNSETKKIQKDIGTGFVVDKNGLVVTNKHVVSDFEAEYVIIDQKDKEFKVGRIYRDPINDLAILKIDGLNLPSLELDDSDKLRVGQSVIAIGTALGEFRHTVTTGVISGLGRGIEAGSVFGETEFLEGVIQTDAAINFGNSGGPLLNNQGQVIGVNVAMTSGAQNIGFAIPINVIKTSLENFNTTGQFDRPLLGISYQMISEKSAILNEVPQGAYVVEVVEGYAAFKEGLKAGDIITELDGQSLKDNDLVKLVNKKKIGDQVKIKYWSGGEMKEKDLTLSKQEE